MGAVLTKKNFPGNAITPYMLAESPRDGVSAYVYYGCTEIQLLPRHL